MDSGSSVPSAQHADGAELCWSAKAASRFECRQESSFAAANELFEPSGNRRVKIDLTDGIGSLEPFFDLSATNLLLDVKGQEIARDVFIDFDAKHLSDS